MLNSRLLRTIMCMAATAVAPVASAYNTFGEWAGNSVRMRASAVSFPVGNAYRTALGKVDDTFERNPSESFFDQTYGDNSVGLGNGQFETWFTGDPNCDPAVTFPVTLFGIIIEADVCFYNGEDYTTSMSKLDLWPFGGAYRPFETTALHEYGHAAGMDHEDSYLQIMGQDWDILHTNGTSCKGYMSEDTANGLISLYGRWSGGTLYDISVTLFRRTGASGAYSTHDFCRVYDSSGSTLLSSSSFNGQRRYTVTSGQTIQVQFTYENSGETTQERRVGFYLSTNSTISTGDTLLKTVNFTLGRNTPYTTKTSVTLPALSAGTYYLGVIVDDNNQLSEVDENNAAYHILRVY